jgi:hypothetical protein
MKISKEKCKKHHYNILLLSVSSQANKMASNSMAMYFIIIDKILHKIYKKKIPPFKPTSHKLLK